jgi:hypothetical protein
MPPRHTITREEAEGRTRPASAQRNHDQSRVAASGSSLRYYDVLRAQESVIFADAAGLKNDDGITRANKANKNTFQNHHF